MDRLRLPLFPLHAVLFPGGTIRLRVFETRYIDMVCACMRDESPFGVVLIVQGSETGAARFCNVGTCASIEDWDTLDDGLLGITARGDSRFEVLSSELQRTGLYVGEARLLPAERATKPSIEPRKIEQMLGIALSSLSDEPPNLEDANWLSYRLAERITADAAFKQKLLECSEGNERLARIVAAVGGIDR